MAVRDARERALQTLCFEAGGLLLVAPSYAWVTGAGAGESLVLIATLSLVVMLWSAVFNTAFDHLEHRTTGRVASDRGRGLRMLQAALHEASAVLVTWPVIVALTGRSWAAALLTDVGLTISYAVYGYGFHLAYDRWRPVGGAGVVTFGSRARAEAAAGPTRPHRAGPPGIAPTMPGGYR